MLQKTRAVVLNTLKYGESQMIVDMLTMSHGRLTFMQRVPRTSRSKVPKQLFTPLNIVDIEFDYRQRRNMQRINEASVAFPLVSIPFDPGKLSIALFVAEFTCYATRSELPDAALYMFVENSVRWLDACQTDFANFHIIYMLHLTRFAGFYPNTDGSDGCYFDMRGGCFSHSVPTHPDFLQPAEASKIRLLMRFNYTTMRLLRMTREERARTLDVILLYYRLHQPAFPEMKSLRVLRQLFV